MIHTIDHQYHHQAISAAKRVTRTVNDKYPTLALAVAMPALVVEGVVVVLTTVVGGRVEDGVEIVGVMGLTLGTDAEVVETALELEEPELEEVEVPESVEFPLVVEVPVAEPEATVMDDIPEPAHVWS